ncbi:MAG: hypothetical protein GYA48_08690 [Chloroflexi bacterium]|nr:hypothetical protein [Chloroflexota bacterium]
MSVNRVAADDCAEEILAVFENTALLTPRVRQALQSAQIEWLGQDKSGWVCLRLFGVQEVDCAAAP